jgi:hypothetical protein
MAISSDASNKMAAVFTGSNDQQYLNDIRKILETLIIYYGYLPENIDVISSTAIPDFTYTGDPDESNIFHTAGLTNLVISGATATLLKEDLQNKLVNNLSACESPIITGFKNSLFLYFTGVGTATSPMYMLTIGEAGGTPVTINQSWFKATLNAVPLALENCQLAIVMQQSYSYGFWSGTNGLSTVAGVDLQIGFLASCDTGEQIVPSLTGSEFTDFLIMALRFVPRDDAGTDIFADEEDTSASILPEDPANHLVSLKKVWFYAKSLSGQNPKYEQVGSEPIYPGLPAFFIRDGNQADPPVAWYESPDIFLTHPNSTDPDEPDEFYYPDEPNNIHILISNSGTHPVREFWVGSIVFNSGGGGAGDSVAFIETVILKPGDVYEHEYDYDFIGTVTHRCVRAKAQLDEINPAELDQDGVDDVPWFVTSRDNEAQRNLDKIAMKSSTAPAPEPGEGEIDEDAPGAEAEAEPEDGNEAEGARSLRNIRGYKEHVYTIRNIFRKPHRFLIVLPEEYHRATKLFRIEWYDVTDKKRNKPVRLKISDKPVPSVPVDLKPGENIELLFYIAARKGVRYNGELRIPFEILVDSKPIKKELAKLFRELLPDDAIPQYASFGGVTVIASLEKPSTLYGKLTDREGKPLSRAYLYIATLNGRQKAVVRSDEKGNYKIPDIDPDYYTLRMKTRSGLSEPVGAMLHPGSYLRIDLRERKPLKDKLRTKGKGKAKLKVNAEVKSTSKGKGKGKAKTNLPATGKSKGKAEAKTALKGVPKPQVKVKQKAKKGVKTLPGLLENSGAKTKARKGSK